MILFSIILIAIGIFAPMIGLVIPQFLSIAIIVVGVCLLLSMIMRDTEFDDYIGTIWFIGIIGYGIYFFIFGTSSKFKIITLIIFIMVLIIACLIALLILRNKLLESKEEISKQKSAVKIAKHKYLTSLDKINQADIAQNQAFIGTRNDSGYTNSYAVSASTVEKLANNLEKAQLELNNLIGEYNKKLKTFPFLLAAILFKFKAERFIDQESLDGSLDLNNYDDSIL